MRIRDRRAFGKPEINIIPMIDIMFFLLVFFMLSTLYMVNIKTVGVDLPRAQHSETQMKVNYLVTMKADGSLWLENESISEQELLQRARKEQQRNAKFVVVLRADQNLEYGMVAGFLDKLKGAGISHFALATESGAE